MWRQALTIDSDDPAGRRWMDGEKTEEEQSSQSRVKSECYVQAGRPGLNHGLCRHHRWRPRWKVSRDLCAMSFR